MAAKLELRFLGKRNVGADADEADEFLVRAEAWLRYRPQPAIFAIIAAVTTLQRESRAGSFARNAFRYDAVDVVWMDPIAPVERARGLQIAPGPAGELGIRFVDEVPDAIQPRDPHERRRGIRNPPESLFALAYRSLGDTLLGDVGDDDDDAVDVSGLRVHPRRVVTLRRQDPALGVLEGGGEEHALAAQRGLHHRLTLGEGLLAQDVRHGAPDHVAPRTPEPFAERLVHEAVDEVTVDKGGHHRKQIGQRQQSRAAEHRRRKLHRERQVVGRSGAQRLIEHELGR